MFLFLQTWNSDLAKVASDYADKCLLAHNARRSIEYDAMIGENIYFTSVDITKRNDLASPVDSWDAEKKYYNYDTLSCSKPACGHYTQVIGGVSVCVSTHSHSQVIKIKICNGYNIIMAYVQFYLEVVGSGFEVEGRWFEP